MVHEAAGRNRSRMQAAAPHPNSKVHPGMKQCASPHLSIIRTALICLCVAGCSMFGGNPDPSTGSVTPLSPEFIVVNAETATGYVTEATSDRIGVFNIDTGERMSSIPLPAMPTGLALHPDGTTLSVTCGIADGVVAVIDLVRDTVIATIDAGHSPCSPVVSPDGARLYICNRFENSLSVIDMIDRRVVTTIPMLREPIAAAIIPDGGLLFVANHLPTGNQIDALITDGGYMGIKGYTFDTNYASKSAVVVINTETYRHEAVIQLPKGSMSLRGICVSPEGKYVYVTHLLARYLQPTRHVAHGGINTNALSVIDVDRMEVRGTVLLDDPVHGAANPCDVMCSDDGTALYVSHSGTHEISIIDRQSFHGKLVRTLSEYTAADVYATRDSLAADLTFMTGIRRRIRSEGNGTRGIAVSGGRVFAAEYFSDSIGVIDTNAPDSMAVRSIQLGPRRHESLERRGERYFNDAELCVESWQSCVSCHPDGRADGLNWDLLNDGEGNPKSTKSLLYSHRTPPVMVTGIRADAETAVRAGITNSLFNDSPGRYAPAIDAYLRSLEPVPSPYLVGGKSDRSARRGARVFRKAGCADCHVAPLFTDGGSYDVRTGRGGERNRAFDTPTLVEIWRTAPYLYKGQANHMYDVLAGFNKGAHHGKTSQLQYGELSDLLSYIMSL